MMPNGERMFELQGVLDDLVKRLQKRFRWEVDQAGVAWDHCPDCAAVRVAFHMVVPYSSLTGRKGCGRKSRSRSKRPNSK